MPLQQITPTDITGTLTNNVASSQLSIGGTAIGAGDASIMKNRIINGAMVIDQRNAGASVAFNDGNYFVDRWRASCSQTGKATAQQNAGSVTPPTGYVNYLGITSSSAYTVGAGEIFTLEQMIEGYNIADLAWGTSSAKTVTLSFWVYSSLTGTFGGALQNQARNQCYPFSYTISSANTWTQISITIAGSTSGTWLTTNGIGIQVNFGMGVGSTYSGAAGSWSTNNYWSATGATSVVGTSGATFYITGVQLEVGSSATGYEYVNYQTSLANCQRYYQLIEGFGGFYLSSTGIVGGISYKTEMRATPTVSATAAIQITQAGVNDYTQSSANASIVASRASSRGAQIQMSNFSGLSSGVFFIQDVGTNNAALSFSAEL